jgi:TonB-linked SusC/RagA family outer membrane protein
MKRKNIKAICLGIAMAVAIPVAAQNKVVQGSVYDELGEPVIGATVIVKGTKYATVTDFSGQYKLEVPKDAKVTVSYVGYVPQVTTGGRISLQEDRNSLEEIVVVGYGTQKMKNVTGAVEAISADELKDLSVGSLGDALVGQFNGVGVVSNGYRPGSSPSLQIRQSSASVSQTPNSTLGGDPDARPRYVIDEFISTETAFNNLDVNEVESITVLKDAAAAVYGSRAAYGVVLVKTKKGKAGAPKISYNGQLGWTDALYTPKMLNAYEYGKVWNAVTAANTSTKDNVDIATKLFQADELEQMKNVDYNLLESNWKAALTQRHGVSMNGGTDKATYFANVNYYTQDGNIGKLDYERWNYRAGVNAKIGNWVKANIQVSGDYGTKTNAIIVSGGGTDGDYSTLMPHLPFVPSYMNGYPLVYTGMQNTTPTTDARFYNFDAVQNCDDNVQNTTNNMNINGSLSFDFGFIKPLKGLTAKVSYTKSINNSKTNTQKTYMNIYGLANRGGSQGHLYTWEGMDVSDVYQLSNLNTYLLNNGNLLARSMSRSDSYQLNFTLQYARKFGLHDLSALFSIERSEAESEDLTGQITNPISYTDGQSKSATGDQYTSFGRSESAMLSYVGRFNYAYADKYLFEFLLRSDASTKFAPANYWAVFPSFSAGWVASEEQWFKDALPWVDFLKLRASWGLLGRDNIQSWLWKQLYNRDLDRGAVFGISSSTQVNAGLVIPQSGVNPDVHWDKNYKTNFGIDARFLDGRLGVGFDYYYDRGRELFMTYTGTSYFPTTVGTKAAPENYGKIDAWGWELNLNWRDKIGKDINYWVKLSTGYNDNKIIDGPFPATPQYNSIVQGERTDRGVWGLKCLGMFRSYQEIQEYFAENNITTYLGKTIDDVHPGMLIYADTHGANDGTGNYGGPDFKIDENDYIRLSKYSDNPYGFTTNFGISYKDFSLTAQLSASWGAYNLVQTDFRKSASNLEYENIPSFWKNMYVYEDIYDAQGNVTVSANRNADYPNMKYSSINEQASSFWLVNAAQITLRNVSVGWTVPKLWLKPVGVSNVRLNLTVQNAIYFLNPYPDKSWASYGGTYGRYPNLRKITMGINVTF